MTTSEVRQKFLDFFKEKGHAIIPSASVVPENDPTVLFTTAGMQPLVPYLIGQPHPMGKRLADAQKCVRTDDIEEVGDNRHLTFFEMLGNWSLGDYFKQESITWSFEFLTDEKWLGIDPEKIYVTVFEGDEDAPRDEDSIGIWQALYQVRGINAEVGDRIRAYPKKKNWWGPAGITGPCGPDTEIFYMTGKPHDPAFGPECHQNCDCGRFVEIWNNVFMQYDKQADGSFKPLAQQNVDTGMGLERIVAVMQNVETVFETDAFQPAIEKIAELSGKPYNGNERAFRIVADHVRAATFIIGDARGVVPSNVGQGYIVRRLLRRAIREGRRLGIKDAFTHLVAEVYVGKYGSHYSELEQNLSKIIDEMKKEEEKFGKTLEKGMKELEKMLSKASISGEDAFLLFSSYGFPLELTEEILKEKGMQVDREVFAAEFRKHQDLSRTASAGVFKGGLADNSVETTRLHTATHLLHQALRSVLGDHVMQKGSNITAERLRFDFSHTQKMTPEELKKVEDLVNEAIKKDYPVHCVQLPVAEAKQRGAIGLFEDKYAQMGDKINVYFVGNEDKGFFSKEICGGPHVEHTGELGSFKIQKEEAVSAGVRRIKATVTG
ncbi:alanine--tRNA ligase [Candidatus Uhrbacteria bacterium]|nr:alanine--tRNA ligase [Candidatus Uhrbacteria bacterium]